ncbi:16S rRNA (guanine(527)-N(7))-methyltransferase RsmG [Anaerococcus degeneri]|uniref:Ribosomal RNA small subunit methyltransferase G n=1 Tax=Anaerococcus degeneri TaxID=361500 RepID=A0ABS7YYX6_9FIRM|nr:16S rRNA (guanine(527)-N(7))-methyltransferase RsmG [Anaerococcus degeneri]MBP2015390.1 16S rRNA (guanine527-N7)-methyltransferase [Anaerococcus degeneri]MCA2096284.1 16S rRNA (guanine(527)-N(7))-methyltransferase RsmG [Anaerococcus degeneri]
MDKKYKAYTDYLLEVNSHTNLTTITDPEEIELKHFKDSLTVLDYIKEGDKVLDLGAGAGFPGIPLRIEKDFDLTLIDSVNKKVNFMNEVIEILGLSNARAIHTRAEDFAKENREGFDVVVSRAVANMSTLSELCLPFVKVGGLFIALKGPKADEEVKAAANALEILGGEVIKMEEIDLDGNERVNVIVKKVRSCKKTYPRGQNLPKRKPL